jgi:hypothetical protein
MWIGLPVLIQCRGRLESEGQNTPETNPFLPMSLPPFVRPVAAAGTKEEAPPPPAAVDDDGIFEDDEVRCLPPSPGPLPVPIYASYPSLLLFAECDTRAQNTSSLESLTITPWPEQTWLFAVRDCMTTEDIAKMGFTNVILLNADRWRWSASLPLSPSSSSSSFFQVVQSIPSHVRSVGRYLHVYVYVYIYVCVYIYI